MAKTNCQNGQNGSAHTGEREKSQRKRFQNTHQVRTSYVNIYEVYYLKLPVIPKNTTSQKMGQHGQRKWLTKMVKMAKTAAYTKGKEKPFPPIKMARKIHPYCQQRPESIRRAGRGSLTPKTKFAASAYTPGIRPRPDFFCGLQVHVQTPRYHRRPRHPLDPCGLQSSRANPKVSQTPRYPPHPSLSAACNFM